MKWMRTTIVYKDDGTVATRERRSCKWPPPAGARSFTVLQTDSLTPRMSVVWVRQQP